MTTCESDACIEGCDQEHVEVARIYASVYACWCSHCDDECSVAHSCEKQCVEDDALPPTATVPGTLAETGLFAGYEDSTGAGGAGAGGAPQLEPGTPPLTLAASVRHFVPKYPLWSDGADKDRYIYVPKCSTIDTSDMDHWQFPVGTRLWKTFTAAANAGAAAGARIETRLIHRHGPGQGDWLFAAYQWDESAPDDPAAATAVPAGVTSANGTTHDIPSREECVNCHGKLRERVLGFSAFQLSHDGLDSDLTIQRVSTLGWLTVPAAEGFEVPGTPVQQAALGYLHGNCGGCHNDNGQLPAASPLLLRLSVGQTEYAQTDLVATTVGIPTFNEDGATSGTLRIAPLDPEGSSVLIRMQARGTDLQMPPLVTTSTKVPDTQGGVADVTAWVSSLQ